MRDGPVHETIQLSIVETLPPGREHGLIGRSGVGRRVGERTGDGRFRGLVVGTDGAAGGEKHQAPTSKHQRMSKSQIPKAAAGRGCLIVTQMCRRRIYHEWLFNLLHGEVGMIAKAVAGWDVSFNRVVNLRMTT